MSTIQNPVCVHGHTSPFGSRFCNTCGEPLKAATPEVGNTIEIGSEHVLSESDKASLDIPNAYLQPATPKIAVNANTTHCSGCGTRFEPGQFVCKCCNTIKPLRFDHHVDPALFQWAMDGQAMAKLRSITPLVAVANQVSKQVGRPWIEANFNGIRLGPRQMPNVYAMAVQAARILGLQKMPGIYVSGERPWNAMTFGSNDDAFIVIGSALVSCFQKSDLMFLFAREMGHIVAGHALWKTVIQICVGEQNAASNMMRNGIAGFLSPVKLIESAIELPLIAWARQAEITADRAGLLASAGLSQARRTLMMWSLRSPMLYRQINIEAWLEQQEEDTSNTNIRLAEAVTSATPYLTRRLKLMQEYDANSDVHQFRRNVMLAYKQQKSQTQSPALKPLAPQPPMETQTAPATAKSIQFKCPACQKPIALSTTNLEGKSTIAVRCPHADCRKTAKLSLPKTQPVAGNETEHIDTPIDQNEALSQMS